MDFQPEDLKQIGKFQRLLILAVAAQLVIGVAAKFIPLLSFLVLPIGIFAIYAMVKLSGALKHETSVTIVYAICAFIPIVSLVALVLIVRKASAMLSAAGYKVGFFGMSQADIDSIK